MKNIDLGVKTMTLAKICSIFFILLFLVILTKLMLDYKRGENKKLKSVDLCILASIMLQLIVNISEFIVTSAAADMCRVILVIIALILGICSLVINYKDHKNKKGQV